MASERRCIHAFTEASGGKTYPGYINLSEQDGIYSLTTRSPGHNGQQVATVEQTPTQLVELAHAILLEFQR
jgi:hypothetical protein